MRNSSAKAVAGDEITFQVQLRDAYGNILSGRLSWGGTPTGELGELGTIPTISFLTSDHGGSDCQKMGR